MPFIYERRMYHRNFKNPRKKSISIITNRNDAQSNRSEEREKCPLKSMINTHKDFRSFYINKAKSSLYQKKLLENKKMFMERKTFFKMLEHEIKGIC
jgi:hypothetical protein